MAKRVGKCFKSRPRTPQNMEQGGKNCKPGAGGLFFPTGNLSIHYTVTWCRVGFHRVAGVEATFIGMATVNTEHQLLLRSPTPAKMSLNSPENLSWVDLSPLLIRLDVTTLGGRHCVVWMQWCEGRKTAVCDGMSSSTIKPYESFIYSHICSSHCIPATLKALQCSAVDLGQGWAGWPKCLLKHLTDGQLKNEQSFTTM